MRQYIAHFLLVTFMLSVGLSNQMVQAQIPVPSIEPIPSVKSKLLRFKKYNVVLIKFEITYNNNVVLYTFGGNPEHGLSIILRQSGSEIISVAKGKITPDVLTAVEIPNCKAESIADEDVMLIKPATHSCETYKLDNKLVEELFSLLSGNFNNLTTGNKSNSANQFYVYPSDIGRLLYFKPPIEWTWNSNLNAPPGTNGE